MTRIRLIADDLTGALDTAAEFAAFGAPIEARWTGAFAAAPEGSLAFDLATREGSRAEAVAAASKAAALFDGADLAYLKVDSLLRGHGMAELGACLSRGRFEHCVVAPAFPYQGRLTRDGRQYRREENGDWTKVADIAGLLDQAGIAARRAEPGRPLDPGVSLFDVESDADLDRIAALRATTPGRILWCGSAGLALALVRAEATAEAALPSASGAASEAIRGAVRGPILGLFGSDQFATAAQIEACGPCRLAVEDGGDEDAAKVAAVLAVQGAAMASTALPPRLPRDEAAARIATALSGLAHRLPRPGTLLVAGGETLRGLCASLGATSLDVIGRIEPGLPVSRLRGGRWDGLTVISKSGAFGGPLLWRDLIAPHLLPKDAC